MEKQEPTAASTPFERLGGETAVRAVTFGGGLIALSGALAAFWSPEHFRFYKAEEVGRVLTVGSFCSFFTVMVTGTISSLKRPAFCAASALFCDETANWS